MTRSLWKGPFVDSSVLKSIDNNSKIWSRRSCILPHFVGKFVQVYNGRFFVGITITEEMVGHKFGEFVSTRRLKTKMNQTAAKKKIIKKKHDGDPNIFFYY
jgi:small subunit ribosomal protein S19